MYKFALYYKTTTLCENIFKNITKRNNHLQITDYQQWINNNKHVEKKTLYKLSVWQNQVQPDDNKFQQFLFGIYGATLKTLFVK